MIVPQLLWLRAIQNSTSLWQDNFDGQHAKNPLHGNKNKYGTKRLRKSSLNKVCNGPRKHPSN